MKIEANPPRLVDGSEFAGILRRARERTVSSQRLEASGGAIQCHIAELSATGAAQSATSMTLGKWAVALAAVTGGGALLWSTSSTTEIVATPVRIDADVVAPEPAVKIEPPASPSQAARPPRRAVPAQPESNLPRQIALLQAAREAAVAGAYPRALEILSRLESDYPASPVMLEAKVARVEYLAASGRIDEGLAAIEELLSDHDLAVKKAALVRFQGDLLLQRGNCNGAVTAYRRAIGLGLSDEDASAARRGIQHCAR